MSSSVKSDSLSGLSRLLRKVAKALKNHESCTAESYEELQNEINVLQTACPNHKGVLQARITWYRWGLQNLAAYIDANLNNRLYDWAHGVMFHSTHSNSQVWAGSETLEFFLKRCYLKEAFPKCFEELVAVYEKMAKIGDVHYAELYKAKIAGLHRKLLEGRL